MLALLFLIGSILMGVAVVKPVTRNLLDPIERIVWGIVCGWLISTLGAYFVARWFGELTATQLFVVTIIVWLLAIAILAWQWRSRASSPLWPRWQNHYTGLTIVLLIF